MTQINRLFDEIVHSMKVSKEQSGKIDVDLQAFLGGLQEVSRAVSHVLLLLIRLSYLQKNNHQKPAERRAGFFTFLM